MDEKKKLRRLPKRIVSFMLTLAMVLTLMPIMSVEVMAVEATPYYTTDEHELMEYYEHPINTYDIRGYINGRWEYTTYWEYGFRPWVYKGPGAVIESTPSFIADGQAIMITYTVTNTGSSPFATWTTPFEDCIFFITADTQIGGNDASTNTIIDDVVVMTNEETGVSLFAFSTTEGGTAVATERKFPNDNYGVSYDSVYYGADPSTVTSVADSYDSAFVMYFPKETIAVGEKREYTFIVGVVDTASVDTTIRNAKAAFHTCGSGVKQDGQAATCTADGWIEYYQCGCGKYYTEADCTHEITNLDTWKATDGQGKIAALGHDWGYNASGATITATCTRNPAHTAALTLTADNASYTGAAYVGASLGGTSAWNNAGLTVPNIEYYQGIDKLDTAPIKVGSYTAKATATVGQNKYIATKDFEITKANPSANPSAKPLTYTGQEQELIKQGTVTGGTIYYDSSQNGDFTSTAIPKGINASNYEVWYKVVGDSNHNDVGPTRIDNVKIDKANITISGITAENKTYDGDTTATLKYDDVVFSGIIDQEELSVTAIGAFNNENAGNDKPVTISDILLHDVEGKDYLKNYQKALTGQQTTTTANISPKEITTTITPNGGTYSKTITDATAVLNDTIKDDSIEPVITYTGLDYNGHNYEGGPITPTNAGEYTITVTLDGTDKDNYNLTGNTNGTFKVDQLPLTDESITLTIPETSFILTSKQLTDAGFKTLNITLRNDSTVLNALDQTKDIDFEITDNSKDAFGKYQVKLEGKGNYTGTLTRDWSITQTKQEPVTINAPEGEDPFHNKLTVTITGDEDAPKVTVNTPLDVLTAEDKTLLKDPAQNVDIDVILTLKNKLEKNIEKDSLAEINKIAKNNKNIRYLDITLDKILKTLGGANNDVVVDEVTVPIHNSATPIEITIDLPKDIPAVKAGYTRKYTIIRSHATTENGVTTYVAEPLTTTYSNGRLTFKTDKFSDYALMYVDTSIPRRYKAPDTGVVGTTTVMTSNGLIEIGALALGSVIGLISTRKKKEDK